MHWKAVLFDLNGTLIDTKQSQRESFKETLDLFLGRWSEAENIDMDDVIETILKAGKAHKSRLRKKEISLQEYRYYRLKEALERYDIPVTKAWAQKVYQQWSRNRFNTLTPYPDLHETIGTLARHVQVGIISNGKQEKVLHRLKQIGADRWIGEERVFATGEKGPGKPNRSVFEKALGQLGVSASDALYVGDSWNQDVKGALGAGMDAVWFNPNGRSKPEKANCHEIQNLKQLLPLVLSPYN